MLAGDPERAKEYDCRVCERQSRGASRKARLGCEEPAEEAAENARPGDRPGHSLHVAPGLRTWACPRALASTPFAASAWSAYRWWDKGQLGPRGSLPARLVEAIDELDAAIARNRAVHYDRRQARLGHS